MLSFKKLALSLLLSVTAAASCASQLDDLVEQGRQALYGQSMDQSYSRALELYQLAAALGSAEAAHQIGHIYQHGLGVESDTPIAISWYEKAAKADFAQSQFTLGQLYEIGDGLPRNLRKALFWYHNAAKNGYDLAQLRLAFMYAKGMGTGADFVQATYYASLAYYQGNQLAAILLETLLPYLPELETKREYSTLWSKPESNSRPVAQVYQGSSVYLLEQINPDWMVVYSPEARRVAYLNTRSFITQSVTAVGAVR